MRLSTFLRCAIVFCSIFLAVSSAGTVNTFSVWIASEGAGITDPSAEFSSIALYGGADPGPLSLILSTYTSFSSHGTYNNGSVNQSVFELTYSGLSWTVPLGSLYDFALQGTPQSPTAGTPLNILAINPSVPGVPGVGVPGPGDGADGFILGFHNNPYTLYFTDPGTSSDNLVGDFNVQITGSGFTQFNRPYVAGSETSWSTNPSCSGCILGDDFTLATPEPSTFAMLGLGAGVLLVFRRRRS